MIKILFGFADEKVLVTIVGENVKFANTFFGAIETDISGLKLNQEGVCREFPELRDEKDWKEKAIKKFKQRIKNLKNEEERAKYVIEDLSKHGYIPEQKQKDGFRPEKIKWQTQ